LASTSYQMHIKSLISHVVFYLIQYTPKDKSEIVDTDTKVDTIITLTIIWNNKNEMYTWWQWCWPMWDLVQQYQWRWLYDSCWLMSPCLMPY